ncbi:MAG: DUF3488 and transglutaminase-like domain-containing protein [Gammaproteobacteria bacterium]|nr:DUF3488 and transglutaminase-like domain-containing protein [Gammaproteobacteria bacterium]
MLNPILLLPGSIKSSLSIHTLLPVALIICMLPHLLSIPAFFSLFILIILLWFALHTLGILSLPGKLIRFTLVFIAIIMLVMNFGFIFSQKAALTLLCIMVSLKFLEISNELDRRNIFLLLFLGYFILVTHFLYSQSFIQSLFSLLNVFMLTLLLSAFNRKPQSLIPITENIRLLAMLFSKALPIAIVLFLFFPRIPGPLWTLPDDGQSSSSGLSDKMFPGSVSELVDSDEIAFRVDFDTQNQNHKTPPAAEKLYWRGPVLSETDGFLWTQKPQYRLTKNYKNIIHSTRDAFSYTVTLEPHQKKWLFALEMPTVVHGDTIEGFYLSNDLQLLNKNNINQLTQYHVTSMTQFTLKQVSDNELNQALTLPGSYNPQTRALGRQWRNTIGNGKQYDKEIVLTALNFFKKNAFYYTKKPDIMLDNPSDQFLFDKKRGFCEHYASSFVILMRAANIPARVVTGYQGMEKNEVGNYYLVRQSNAHAWAEVWLNNEGWLRIDPTAAIPPERIEEDIFQTNLERLNFSSLNIPDLPSLSSQQKTAIYNFWKQLNHSIDNIKHSWNNWILGYDKSKQSLLLKLMGLNTDWQTLILLLIGGFIAVIVLLQVISFYQRHQQTDQVYRYYRQFISKLNHAGFSPGLNDGPAAIKHMAIERFPEQKKSIQTIMDNYILIRYASHNEKPLIQQFITQIKQFKP